MPRFYSSLALKVGQSIDLPASAARHVQVLRMQPQMAITLFDGLGGEYAAVIQGMGRSSVTVEILEHFAIEREAKVAVTLAVGVPANERMDWLVEKATELGVAAVQPLLTERSVVRLGGERADKRRLHWQGIAIAACEQSGRNRLPEIRPILTLTEWLAQSTRLQGDRLILSLQNGATAMPQGAAGVPLVLLSGAEGGLSPAEEASAMRAGFQPITLGARVLRAETAALAGLILAQSTSFKSD